MLALFRRIGTDRLAMTLSGLCLVHCIGGALLVSAFAVLGSTFGNPLIHEVGLALAIPLALFALGRGWIAHRRRLPLALGAVGVSLMTLGLMVPHGDAREVVFTVIGVSLVAAAHYMNRRALACGGC